MVLRAPPRAGPDALVRRAFAPGKASNNGGRDRELRLLPRARRVGARASRRGRVRRARGRAPRPHRRSRRPRQGFAARAVRARRRRARGPRRARPRPPRHHGHEGRGRRGRGEAGARARVRRASPPRARHRDVSERPSASLAIPGTYLQRPKPRRGRRPSSGGPRARGLERRAGVEHRPRPALAVRPGARVSSTALAPPSPLDPARGCRSPPSPRPRRFPSRLTTKYPPVPGRRALTYPLPFPNPPPLASSPARSSALTTRPSATFSRPASGRRRTTSTAA